MPQNKGLVLPKRSRRFSGNEFKNKLRSLKWSFEGKVLQVVGTVIEAYVPGAQVSTIVKIEIPGREKDVIGEVVGWVFNNEMGGYRIK